MSGSTIRTKLLRPPRSTGLPTGHERLPMGYRGALRPCRGPGLAHLPELQHAPHGDGVEHVTSGAPGELPGGRIQVGRRGASGPGILWWATAADDSDGC